MAETKITETNDIATAKPKKLHSKVAIGLATFIGSPIAAGVLLNRNLANLGRRQAGINALAVCVMATFMLLGGVFLLPEPFIDKIPRVVFPTIHTIVVIAMVEHYMGTSLREHKEQQLPFYSIWNGIGTGTLFLAIIVVLLVGMALFQPSNFDAGRYDDRMTVFSENEEDALQLFHMLDSGNTADAPKFITTVGVPKWQENLTILTELDSMEDIDLMFQEQNQILRLYCQKRIDYYELLSKSISENTNENSQQLKQLDAQIDELVEKL